MATVPGRGNRTRNPKNGSSSQPASQQILQTNLLTDLKSGPEAGRKGLQEVQIFNSHPAYDSDIGTW